MTRLCLLTPWSSDGDRCALEWGHDGDQHKCGDKLVSLNNYNTGHLKSGCHDERGILAFYGAGMPRGVELAQYDNLNVAPTLMRLLGLPTPAEMRSEPIREIAAGTEREWRPNMVA